MSRSAAFYRLLLRRRIPANYPAHPFVSTRSPLNPIFTTQIRRSYQSRNTGKNEFDLSDIGTKRFNDMLLQQEERMNAALRVAAHAKEDGEGEGEEVEAKGEGEEEEEDDFLGIRPLLEKYKRQNLKDKKSELYMHEEPTDSDSEDEYDEAKNMRLELFEKRLYKLKELKKKFLKAATLDDAYKLMKQIDKFEEKLVPLRSEYQVIGDLMKRLRVAEGKDKFLLQMKLNRAVKLVEWKEAFEPRDPINYGLIEQDRDGAAGEREEDEEEQEKKENEGKNKEGEGSNADLDLDDLEEKDSDFLEKIDEIDKKLEQKLAELEFTFGKKGKLLEEEIRDLAEERNTLTEQKTQPLYRKGFDVRLLDMNRTCKVTKGGQVIKYTALLACGNYSGLVGFATARAPTVNVAIQKARAKCFENLHYIERHENHTIAHAIQTSYKKTKIYLWPAPSRTGIKAGRTVHTILDIAGFKNMKSKVIGSRNPQNTVKALFKALNAIETPKDVEQKFGRTVVESYLM